MNQSRREQIEAMLADDPTDIFLRYSLALEWAKEDRPEESLEGLRQLMQQPLAYIPAFFMAGKLLAGLRRLPEARQVLQAGIEVAQQQGETHAADKMGEFLVTLGTAAE